VSNERKWAFTETNCCKEVIRKGNRRTYSSIGPMVPIIERINLWGRIFDELRIRFIREDKNGN